MIELTSVSPSESLFSVSSKKKKYVQHSNTRLKNQHIIIQSIFYGRKQ